LEEKAGRVQSHVFSDAIWEEEWWQPRKLRVDPDEGSPTLQSQVVRERGTISSFAIRRESGAGVKSLNKDL